MQEKKKVKELQARIGAELRAQFPEKFNFSRRETAGLVGCVEGHLSNCEVDDKPIIVPVRVGRRKVVYPFNRIVDYLVTQQIKIRRGPRSKAEHLAQEGVEA